MVQLYCSEQIVIPQTLPFVLKTYAKAAIRTQPYDVLRWSAEYFHCLANDVRPPAKVRLDKDCLHGHLTKGYLRVLIDQVGRGYFIDNALLQKKWKALSLPEEELFKFLSLCRMLDLPQVHWLKLLAVLVASMTKNPCDAMTMLCELLTDDLEGGLARIPYWMFKICYTYIAELECSQEQCFVNGRRVLPNGDLEIVPPMQGIPQILSASLLRDTIIEQCRQQVLCNSNFWCRSHIPIEDAEQPEKLSSSESSTTSLSSGFKFLNEPSDPKKFLDQIDNFDTLILCLKEAQKPDKAHVEMGPHYITQAQMEHAKAREEEIAALRERQAIQYKVNSDKIIVQDNTKLLREVGPPWNWLHQFVDQNCQTGTYNFIEEQSIVSDATPELSSDESFDFVKEKPIANGAVPSLTSLTETSSGDVAADLLGPPKDHKSDSNSCFENLLCCLKEAEKQKKLEGSKTSSVVSFLEKEELGVLERAGEPLKSAVSIRQITDILQQVQQSGGEFQNLQEMVNFIQTQVEGLGYSGEAFQGGEDEAAGKESSLLAETESSIGSDLPYGGTDDGHLDRKSAVDKPEEEPPVCEVMYCINDKKVDSMTELFENSGITPDPQALQQKASSEMILGLVDKPDVEEESPVEINESDITSSGNYSGNGHRSDDSSIFPSTHRSEESKRTDYRLFCCDGTEENRQPEPFHCAIKYIPGIGKQVSQKTIERFLAYLKFRARSQKGLITPQNFTEENCPNMIDIN